MKRTDDDGSRLHDVSPLHEAPTLHDGSPLHDASPLTALVAALRRHSRLALAVSGGVDSMTLAHVAHRHARIPCTIYHAAGPAVPASARARVEAHAAREGWSLVVLDAGELADEAYRANPVDRCYYCKTNLYGRIRTSTDDTIASGTNRDDLADYRPGLRAAGEWNVVHPYVEAGLDKAAVYALAAAMHLSDLERLPAQPCLSSRVETGIAIDPHDLGFIEQVEAALGARFGEKAVVRCRVTWTGVVIELGAHCPDDANAVAQRVGGEACRAAGRRFAGVRAYTRGAAFLRSRTSARAVSDRLPLPVAAPDAAGDD